MVPFFLDTESGEIAHAPFVQYRKVQAVLVDPVSRRGFMAIDGEGRPVEPAVAEIFPGLARLMMPAESHHAHPRPQPSPKHQRPASQSSVPPVPVALALS